MMRRDLGSQDGSSWRALDVTPLPPDFGGYVGLLTVAGDVVVALVSPDDSAAPYRIWVGSLAAMGT